MKILGMKSDGIEIAGDLEREYEHEANTGKHQSKEKHGCILQLIRRINHHNLERISGFRDV
jgi:hypothetical protein